MADREGPQNVRIGERTAVFFPWGNQKIPDAFSFISCIIEYMKILLDEIMEQRNLTERQVSILTGLSRSSVHEIRKGSMPRADTLEQLAKGLKIKISDLVESEYL